MNHNHTNLPPFYWNAPGTGSTSDKNYLNENVRRIKKMSSNNKMHPNSGREPLKATYIPGVTKNSRYAHVTSRFQQAAQNAKRVDDDSTTKQRLVKSNEDLRNFNNKPNGVAFGRSSSGTQMRVGSSERVNRKVNQRPAVKANLDPSEESVYNWRFSEQSLANNHQHKVEYFPCDGICADESVADQNGQESGRSSSRTSRGMNTEETRIFQGRVIGPGTHSASHPNLKYNGDNYYSEDDLSGDVMKMSLENGMDAGGDKILPVNFRNGDHKYKNGHSQTSHSQFILKNDVPKNHPSNSVIKSHMGNYDGSGTPMTPHAPGTVPKYLKQRQEEWKQQEEERKIAERDADIPEGHILLSEKQRAETISNLKKSYDDLVNELNRIPISMDTIRVREQKVRIEAQLTKIEEAQRIFGRTRVFIKITD